jgi:competence protein ComEA
MPRGNDLNLKPAWWIAYGVVCGLAAAGVILLLASPRRGQPIVLRPAPTRVATQAEAATAGIPSETPTAAVVFPLNLNTATVQELEQLPGIGPVLAQDIIAYRQVIGAFTDLSQLQNIPKIGPQTYEAILPFVTLGSE